jgi:outer membrane protein
MKMHYHLFICFAFIALVSTSASAQTVQDLTRSEAEKIAIENHPKIQAAMQLANVAEAQVTQARSAYYPLAYGSLTGALAESNSRVAAGSLNNPIIYNRYANGVTLNQLVTDFGRTHQLVKSSDFHAQAQQADVLTSRADVLLEVDRAYFSALKAQAVLTVAEQTVNERQLVADQIRELEKNKIKSGLDVSFANVALAQAQLLLIQAQNDLQASFAELSTALGYSDQRTFHLSEEPLPPAPPSDVTGLIQQALKDRPELVSQRFEVNSARSYTNAESDLWFPTISAVATAGIVPVAQEELAYRYAAAGFNVNIPLFNGFLYSSLRQEASSQERVQEQRLRDLQNRIIRDVGTTWLGAKSAYQRIAVTDQLRREANEALDLAQSRYKLGLSSIVELSQAQLNQTQAQIEQASAKYDYATQISVLNYQFGNLH